MATLTNSVVAVTEYVFNLIEANKATLGLADVFYGDQEKIPRTPTVCVESGDKRQELNGVPRRVDVGFETILLVYHSKIQQTQISRREVEDLTDRIEALLHTDRTLDGLVIHCYVTGVEPGYMSRGGTMMRASRITLESMSKVQLPYP